MSDAGLVAGDAGAHVVAAPGLGLIRHLRVADQRAGHAADVGLASGEDGLGLLGLVDAPGDEQRDRQARLEGTGFAGQVGRLDGHRRDDMDGAAEGGRSAGDDVQVVQLALDRLGRLQRLAFAETLGVALVGGQAQADDEVLGGGRAHRCQHFAEEKQAGIEVAVVAILAAVHPRVEELRRQVAVAGDHLHPVQSCLVQAARGGGVAGDDLVDQRLVEFAWHHPEPFVGRGRGGIGHRQQAVGGLHDLAPGMEDLRQHHAAFGVAGLGDPPVAGDAGIVGGHQHVRGVARAVVDPGHLHDDQSGAAAGPGAVIGDEWLVDQVVGRHRRVVAARHDAVFQAFAPDFQGLNRCGKFTVGVLLVVLAARFRNRI